MLAENSNLPNWSESPEFEYDALQLVFYFFIREETNNLQYCHFNVSDCQYGRQMEARIFIE
jgi:hypothetical protein